MGAGPDDVVCGVVARLVWEKGYRELFAAAAALRDRYPQLRVVAVGETDHDKADAVTPADIDAAERESGVHFLGHRSDVEDLYAAFDVSVLASHREGFPRTPMEAAATGVPVVATDIRGCRQVVDDGVTGLLVPRADAPALARAIETLVVDSARRAQMGVAALDKARREFDQQRQIDITLDVYRALTGRARAAAA
jgi:glycosyltransferase involved in cell wall biosynthesis